MTVGFAKTADPRRSAGLIKPQMNPAHGGRADRDESHECDCLCCGERRFVLRGSQRMQRRNLEERLHDQHEKIQVQRGDRRRNVDPAPGTAQRMDIQGHDRRRQQDQRDDADDVRRQQVVTLEAEAGDAGRNRRRQEKQGPAGHACGPQHAGGDDQSAGNADQAQCHVDKRERRHPQDHFRTPRHHSRANSAAKAAAPHGCAAYQRDRFRLRYKAYRP